MPTKNDAFDDWMPELPALDGDDDETQEAELDHELASFEEDSPDPFDDEGSAALFDNADGIDFDAVAESYEEDEREVDIGEITIDEVDDDATASADEDADLGDDGLEIDEPLAACEDDGGEEGTLDASDWVLDERLPELDADDDDELSEGLLLDDGDAMAFDDERLPGWADVAWEIKLETTPLDARGEVISLSFTESAALAITARGELLSANEALAGCELVPAPTDGDELAQVALTPKGRAFLLTAAGGLWVREGDAITRTSCSNLLSIATSEEEVLVAVSADPARGLELFVSEDAAASLTARELEGPAIVVAAAPNPWLAASGKKAIGIGSEAGLVVSRDGSSFELVPGCAGTVAVAFAGEGDEAPLVAAVYREAEDRTFLVRLSAEGLAEVVAELGPSEAANEDDEPEPLGRANALAWDAERKVLWVAGAFGIVALAA